VFLRLSDPAGGGLPVRIRDIEDLGNYRIATVSLGEHRLRVHLSEDQEIASESASLSFAPEWTRLYVDEVLVQ
jgi:glycerol transport system ATP-binding protein